MIRVARPTLRVFPARTHRLTLAATAALLLLASGLPAAQTSAPVDRFEVVSVRRTATPLGRMGARQEPGGRFVAANLSLRDLIELAYKVRAFQVIGGPSWLATDRFDIVAKAERELPPFNTTDDVGPVDRMLQALLTERFQLAVRRENREMPVYALVRARGDGRLGEKLRPSSADCAAIFAKRARSAQPAQGPLMAGDRPTCGMVIAPWSIRMGGSPLSQLATVLSRVTNRLVIDRTGLTDTYDIDLQWTPQGIRTSAPAPGDAPAPQVPAPPLDPNGAPLETAIQEQLGLKLDPERASVPVLVIERAEPPRPD